MSALVAMVWLMGSRATGERSSLAETRQPSPGDSWTYQNCQCFVTSADGWAGIASYDDVVGNVDAAWDAFVWLLGDFNGDVDAGVWTYRELSGSVIEFDGTVATEYPTRSPPPSFVDELLADAAEVYVEFAEQRIERGEVIDQLITLRDATWTSLYVQTAPQSGFDQSEFNLWDYAPTWDELRRVNIVLVSGLGASLYYGTTLTSIRGFHNGWQSGVANELSFGNTPDFHLLSGQDDPYYDGAFLAGNYEMIEVVFTK
jgi:hypothetical protein